MIRQMLRKIVPSYLRNAVGAVRKSTYAEDGLVAARITEFLFSARFDTAYRVGKSTGSWGTMDLRWRVFVACWAAQHAKSLPGDFVECGVSRGGMARAVMEYVGFSGLNKTFYLLDSYNGIPEEMKLSSAPVQFDYSDCYDAVKQTFASFPNARVIRGTVPTTLRHVDSTQIAYLSIDMNCAEPEIAAAEFFWDKLSAGGVILLDDYCYSEDYRLQNRAFQEFAKRRGIEVLALPTGQGLIFKQHVCQQASLTRAEASV
jgi:O-methyltransferase